MTTEVGRVKLTYRANPLVIQFHLPDWIGVDWNDKSQLYGNLCKLDMTCKLHTLHARFLHCNTSHTVILASSCHDIKGYKPKPP